MTYLLDDLGKTMSLLLPLARRDDVDLVLPVAWRSTNPFVGLR